MCSFAITLERNTDYERRVPCGYCYQCKRTYVASWIFRLQAEVTQYPTTTYYTTLTYNPKSLPLINGETMTLRKSDFQNFLKRLRQREKRIGNDKQIRYFAVGEYGSKRGRPHYHCILFNVTCMDNIVKAWDKGLVYNDIYNPQLGGGAYLCKYLAKDKFNKRKATREKEFLLVSKGFGANYLTPNMVNFHLSDPYTNSNVLVNGKLVPMPKYYKDKIYGNKNENRELVTMAMNDLSQKLTEAKIQEYKFIYPEFDEDKILQILDSQNKHYTLDVFKKEKIRHYGVHSRNLFL